MRRLILTMAVLLLPAVPARADLTAADLELVSSQRLSPRLVQLEFRTPALTAPTRVRVLLPDGYERRTGERFPVLYLLHGGFASYADWTDKGNAERITAGRPLIVVMPDTGREGGYTDWHNHGAGGPPRWQTYHLRQLVPWIDAHFRTTGTRAGRAIAGLSMGGGGAMMYAARQPDMFVAAASFSGAVDTNSPLVQPLSSSGGLSQGKLPGAVWGHRATDEVRWRGHNPWDLAENLAGLDLTVRTGNGLPGGPGGDAGDPVEFEVWRQSTSFHERLDALGIPHLWDDYGPGGHNWWYWQRGLRQLLPALERVFADPPDPPERVTYRAIDPSFEAYGWQVEIDRPALEFGELRGAARDGFAVRGSGTATVTTPPAYRAGSVVRVRLSRGTGTAVRRLRVGADCRLRLRVPFGPGNPHQQYTVQAQAAGTKVFTTRVRISAGPPC